MKKEIQAIKQYVSGERAYTDVKEIANFHRIPGRCGVCLQLSEERGF